MSELLLEYGADVHARNKNLSTALHVAAWHGKVDVVKSLLERGAKIDAVDRFGDTPLQSALRTSSKDREGRAAAFLKEYGRKGTTAKVATGLQSGHQNVYGRLWVALAATTTVTVCLWLLVAGWD